MDDDLGPRSSDASEVAIQSLARANAILDVVARQPEGIRLAHLAREVGLHPSTTHHLVRSMVALCFLRQDPATKRYCIGNRVVGLATAMMSEIQLAALARPILADLADRVLGATQLALVAGPSAVIIGKYEGLGRYSILERPTTAAQSAQSLQQRAVLAALPPDELDTFYGRQGPFHPDAGTANVAGLVGHLSEISGPDMLIDDREFDSELVRLALPVQRTRRDASAAVGLSIPVWRLGVSLPEEIIDQFRRAVTDLSRSLSATDF